MSAWRKSPFVLSLSKDEPKAAEFVAFVVRQAHHERCYQGLLRLSRFHLTKREQVNRIAKQALMTPPRGTAGAVLVFRPMVAGHEGR